MSTAKELAQAAKAAGNAAFSSGDYAAAVRHFTDAISHDPTDAIFFSNRSGAYASLSQPQQALDDAERCIQLNPAFIKGHSRKGQALFTLGRYADAKAAYEDGLKVDPANAALKESLDQVEVKLSAPSGGAGGGAGNPFGSMFGPDMWGKLMADPTTRAHLNDTDFRAKMNELQKNPSLFAAYSKDPKVGQALGVLLGLGPDMFRSMGNMGGMGAAGGARGAAPGSSGFEMEDDEDDDADADEIHAGHAHPHPPRSTASSGAGGAAEEKKEEKEPPSKPEAELTQEEKDKREAEKEKEAGNAAFKAKRFDEALEHYEKAAALDPTAIVYPNNASACYFEKKDYDRCIEMARKAIAIGQEAAGFYKDRYKDVAKAWSRIGNAYAAQKRWAEAIEAYEKSSVEVNDVKIRDALKKALAAKKKVEETDYINPQLSEEEKAKGNELFQKGQWIDAIAHYTEALKRNPDNYKVYSNRAACYTKLMDWQRGLDDCEACLKRDGNFVKAYIRKGKIHHFLKQYHKALEAYEKGLALDPDSSELREERQRTLMAINTGEADPERAKEAMKDPEIQQILRDPTINKVLQDLQQNPAAGQAAMRDKDIKAKIEKLIAAGVLGVK